MPKAIKKVSKLQEKYAAKAKKTTSKDVPGKGLARGAGKALESRKSRIDKAVEGATKSTPKKKKAK